MAVVMVMFFMVLVMVMSAGHSAIYPLVVVELR